MDGYGKRVLIVDDDENARNLLSLLLERAGYNVHHAGDGLEAAHEMKKRRFDAVLTDYRMPRLDGLKLLLLSRIVWPATPVIMISGESSDQAELAVERGAAAWIQKPYEPKQVLRLLRTTLQSGQGIQAGQMSAKASV